MPSRRERAGVPTYPDLRRETLLACRELPMPATRSEVIESVTNRLALTEEQRAVPCANGSMSEVADRVGWTISFLKEAGALENVGVGVWSVTDEGFTITFEEIERRLAEKRSAYLRRRRASSQALPGNDDDSDDDDDLLAIGSGAQEESWQDRLLERLGDLTPTGFEKLTRELLLRAGFDDVEVTQSSRDGGIDGFGTYRPSGLISFRTSFQCKRWKSPVRSPEVQAFQGAILGQSDRGIIITTSYFTKDAIEQASRPGGLRIDLIDGARLVELMEEHQIGVHTAMIQQVTIDDAYFDRFN